MGWVVLGQLFGGLVGSGSMTWTVLGCIVSANGRLDVNVALNRPSYQISTFSNADRSLHASYANDGNKATNLRQAPYCAKTNPETNPWWSVDLGVPLYVWGIKLTNRGDRYGACGFLQLLIYLVNHVFRTQNVFQPTVVYSTIGTVLRLSSACRRL